MPVSSPPRPNAGAAPVLDDIWAAPVEAAGAELGAEVMAPEVMPKETWDDVADSAGVVAAAAAEDEDEDSEEAGALL